MNLILISVFVSFVIFPYCGPLIRHVPEKLARVEWTGRCARSTGRQANVDSYQDLFRAAKIGQQGRDNGVLILVSVKEHKIRIHTGRGLEGALPDALCIRIIRDDFSPQFQTGNYDEGFRRGLAAVIARPEANIAVTGKR